MKRMLVEQTLHQLARNSVEQVLRDQPVHRLDGSKPDELVEVGL